MYAVFLSHQEYSTQWKNTDSENIVRIIFETIRNSLSLKKAAAFHKRILYTNLNSKPL